MNHSRLIALVAFKTYAELRAEISRYFLSILWWVFDPILSMLVYYLVFGLMLNRGGEDFVPFLLIGLVTWQWFERCALHGMSSIYNNGYLINMTPMPKLYFPAVTTAVDTVKFGIVFILLIFYLWLYGFSPGPAYLALPLVIGIELLFLSGVALLLAGLMPLFPDLKYLAEVGLRLAFFASGIFYSGSELPEAYQEFFYLNPMVNLIEAYRDILMLNRWPDWNSLLAVAAAGLIILVSARLLILRFEYYYPRILSR